MWTLPGQKIARIYNILTVLLALPCCYILMRLVLSDIRAQGELFDGSGMVIGGAWLVVPLLGLAGVAMATFPSVPAHTRSLISAISFGAVFILAALPLFLIFVI